jgi:hypothetical protein
LVGRIDESLNLIDDISHTDLTSKVAPPPPSFRSKALARGGCTAPRLSPSFGLGGSGVHPLTGILLPLELISRRSAIQSTTMADVRSPSW